MSARVRPIQLLPLVAVAACWGCATPKQGQRWVHSLTVTGVHDGSARSIKSGLATKPTAWWDFRHKRLYDELLLDADRDRVLRYYRERGYYAAEVRVAATPRKKDARAVDVRIEVHEGLPTRIQELRLLGTGDLGPVPQRRVEEAQLAVRRGQIFVHHQYLELKDELTGSLKNLGYPWASVMGEVQVDPKRNVADIQLVLDPGPPSTIGSIEIVNGRSAPPPTATVVTPMQPPPSQIDPMLVKRAFGIQPGSKFNWSDLELGRGRVLALGVFSNVAMSYTRDPDHPDVVHVTLRVTDSSMHQLRVGGGVGIEAQRNEIRLQLLYTKRNFLGGLRTMELRLRPAYVVVPAVWSPIVRHGPAVTGEAVFSQPWAGPFTRLQLTVGYDLGVEYAYQYHGPRFQLALLRLLWKDRVAVTASYNFQFIDFFATSPEILADSAQAGKMYGYTDPYRLAWLQQDLVLDLRNDRVEPRKGFYASATFEEGGIYVGGAFTYEKLKVGARGYVPLGSRVVIAARLEFGQMWSQGNEGSPITRRLYLGGANSHRGFSEGRLSPQIPVVNGIPLPIGGDQSILASAEVRVDLVSLAGSMLVAAAFLDAGDVSAAAGDTVSGWRNTVDIARLHTAVGGGLRYRTPIGVVRADLGVRLNRVEPFEADGQPNPDPGQRVAFHISLAEAF